MSKPINDGGPAFPTDYSNDPSYTNITGGMSLRDYFAAAALTGLIANTSGRKTTDRVRLAWEYADAMIAERAK